ncbi:MAG: hypothetical protein ACRDS1_02980 [Pseudonocardiaceae bacterium]
MGTAVHSAAELKLVADEAHQLGLPVAVHPHGTSSVRAAVNAGVDTIEHCTWLSGPGVLQPDEQIACDS